MNSIENKFEVISLKWIANYIDELYEPYKIYGNLDELLANVPEYIVESKNYDGQLKTWVKNGDRSYVIFNPNPDEIKKLKQFRAFEEKHKKLIDLRLLQINYSNKNLTETQANEIEDKIDLIIKEVFGSKKTILVTNSPKISNIKELFRKEGYFDEIKELLIKNNLIRISEEKIQWLGILDDPALKPLKSLCTLFVVLEQYNYLIPNPSNTIVAQLITKTFSTEISDKVYGNTKKALSNRGFKSTEEAYFDFFHFIPRK